MARVCQRSHRLCEFPACETEPPRILLKVGGLGLAGLSLPSLLQAEDRPRQRKATARSVILLFQFGGASHLDSFDPKPSAPREIRGEFATIETPRVGDARHRAPAAHGTHRRHLRAGPQRSSHAIQSQSRSLLLADRHKPLSDLVTSNASATDFPHPGAIVDYLDPSERKVPPFVSLPTMIADGPFRTPGEFAGFLGKNYDPLWVLADPNAADFNVEQLTLPAELDVEHVHERGAILRELDAKSRMAEHVAAVKGMKAYNGRAIDLLTSSTMRKAFACTRRVIGCATATVERLRAEILLARRLVEAGVRFVTVYYSAGIGGWDTHKDNFSTLRNRAAADGSNRLGPARRPEVAASGRDAGLLDGGFWRAPKIKDAGRDHWPPCQTVLMAGGGIRGSQVPADSDALVPGRRTDRSVPMTSRPHCSTPSASIPKRLSTIRCIVPCPSPPVSRSMPLFGS